MAVLSKNDLFTKLHDFIGDNTSEEAIGFMEDITDTFNEIENRANGDGEDWKKRYEDNDAAWKKKYQHRFFSSGGGNYDNEELEGSKKTITPDSITINDLFS